MKAILKSNRNVTVDVELHEGIFLDEIKDGIRTQKAIYKDKNTGYLYAEDDLEWVEYYGG